jgi:hypothetical protein
VNGANALNVYLVEKIEGNTKEKGEEHILYNIFQQVSHFPE